MAIKANSIVDALDHPDWEIEGWQIKFQLSERLLHDVKKISGSNYWYEDPIIAATWTEKLWPVFGCIQKFYRAFGVLPQVGDSIASEGLGLIVQERAINGKEMAITLTVTS